MARLTTYQNDTTITANDRLLGTDESGGLNTTRNFTVGELRDFITNGLGTNLLSQVPRTWIPTVSQDGMSIEISQIRTQHLQSGVVSTAALKTATDNGARGGFLIRPSQIGGGVATLRITDYNNEYHLDSLVSRTFMATGPTKSYIGTLSRFVGFTIENQGTTASPVYRTVWTFELSGVAATITATNAASVLDNDDTLSVFTALGAGIQRVSTQILGDIDVVGSFDVEQNISVGGNATITGTTTQTGVATFTNGLVSNANIQLGATANITRAGSGGTPVASVVSVNGATPLASADFDSKATDGRVLGVRFNQDTMNNITADVVLPNLGVTETFTYTAASTATVQSAALTDFYMNYVPTGTFAVWDSATAYSIGDLVSETVGLTPPAANYYTAVTANTNVDPGTDNGTNWREIHPWNQGDIAVVTYSQPNSIQTTVEAFTTEASTAITFGGTDFTSIQLDDAASAASLISLFNLGTGGLSQYAIDVTPTTGTTFSVPIGTRITRAVGSETVVIQSDYTIVGNPLSLEATGSFTTAANTGGFGASGTTQALTINFDTQANANRFVTLFNDAGGETTNMVEVDFPNGLQNYVINPGSTVQVDPNANGTFRVVINTAAARAGATDFSGLNASNQAAGVTITAGVSFTIQSNGLTEIVNTFTDFPLEDNAAATRFTNLFSVAQATSLSQAAVTFNIDNPAITGGAQTGISIPAGTQITQMANVVRVIRDLQTDISTDNRAGGTEINATAMLELNDGRDVQLSLLYIGNNQTVTPLDTVATDWSNITPVEARNALADVDIIMSLIHI